MIALRWLYINGSKSNGNCLYTVSTISTQIGSKNLTTQWTRHLYNRTLSWDPTVTDVPVVALQEVAILDATMETVYIANENATYAINASDGSMLWTTVFQKTYPSSSGLPNPPSYPGIPQLPAQTIILQTTLIADPISTSASASASAVPPADAVPATIYFVSISMVSHQVPGSHPKYYSQSCNLYLCAVNGQTGTLQWNVSMMSGPTAACTTNPGPPYNGMTTSIAVAIFGYPITLVHGALPNTIYAAYGQNLLVFNTTVGTMILNKTLATQESITDVASGPNGGSLLVQTCFGGTYVPQPGETGPRDDRRGWQCAKVYLEDPELFPNSHMVAFDAITHTELWNVSTVYNLPCPDGTTPPSPIRGQGISNGVDGPGMLVSRNNVHIQYSSQTGDVPQGVQFYCSSPSTYTRQHGLATLSLGYAVCPATGNVLNAAFPDGVTVTEGSSSCTQEYAGSCQSPYVGSVTAKCCWNNTTNTSDWIQSTSKGNTPCSLPSANCPLSSSSIHASFAAITVPKQNVEVCTTVVDGTCDPGFSGSVQAHCCWNPLNQNATWAQESAASLGCVEVAVCPTHVEQLHATFPANISIPESNAECPVALGQCDVGYVGNPSAKCCWDTISKSATWVQESAASLGCIKETVCPAHVEQLHATFPANTIIPESNAKCNTAPVAFGRCDVGYIGTPSAKCCWDTTSKTSKWTLAAAGTACIKLASCPTDVEPLLHATFEVGVVVPEVNGTCTSPKQGQCTKFFHGAVDAQCCWGHGENNRSAFWKKVVSSPTASGCKSIWPIAGGALAAALVAVVMIYKCGRRDLKTNAIDGIYESLDEPTSNNFNR